MSAWTWECERWLEDAESLASAALRALRGVQEPARGELFIRVADELTAELDPVTGAYQESRGLSVRAAARVWRDGRLGVAQGLVAGEQELAALVGLAGEWAGSGAEAPRPSVDAEAGQLQSERALVRPSSEGLRALGAPLLDGVRGLGVTVQALFLEQRAELRLLAVSEGRCWVERPALERAMARCETSQGAVLDALAAPVLGGARDVTALLGRLRDALEALEGPGEAPDPSLPLALRPTVAAPLVAGLGVLLRGDVAAGTPALARALGKRLFPSAFTLVDEPGRQRDDEGQRASRLVLVERGQLATFLHSTASAALLGTASNARAVREPGGLLPAPGAFGLHIAPGESPLPDDCCELTARLETFTTMPKPGTVSLIAAGWERRGGQRVRRVRPFELELPVLPTLRRLRAVGPDLTFLPALEGCGTPTLLFDPLLRGAP
ncbi:metallopeptidase TldD-related protein [Archangium sp.]|uniref:metallopeptidase TldD-related protein n=1 Tax=Archangium sp. TaxID=1872627 RepID=UPI00286B5730|nr:metallopeptidase TldD-related protein [Archangium sp.]